MSENTTPDETAPPTWPSDRSERAHALVQAGKIGGARPGSGRPRKPRASELAAEAAGRNWTTIERALLDGVTTGTPEQRARTAARWISLAQAEDGHDLRAQKDRREADAVDRLTADQVLAAGADVVMRMLQAGRIDLDQVRAQIEPATDAEVIDDD